MEHQPPLSPFFAYSCQNEVIAVAIYTNAGVSEAFEIPENIPFPTSDLRIHWVKALWDTGAMSSCISKRLAIQLGLRQIGVVEMATASHIVEAPIYLAHLILPNGLSFSDMELLEFQDTSDDCDIIIGMDLITQGDFSITNTGGRTLFSFRMPSLQAVDYELELLRILENE